MNNVLWEISKRIIFEQRYQSLKGNTAFISRFNREGRMAGRSLRSYIVSNYVASVFSFALLSVALTSVRIFSGETGYLVELEILLFFYVFAANIFNSIIFFDGIVTENLLQPISSIPLVSPQTVLPVSYMIYYGSSSTFVITPFLVIEYMFNHSLILFGTGLIWMTIYIFLGYLVGTLVFYFLYPLRNPSKPSIFKNIGTVLRILVIVLIFSFFEIWIYDANILPPSLVPASLGTLRYFIPVVNTGVLVTNSISMFEGMMELLVLVPYAVICLLIYFMLHGRVFQRLLIPRTGRVLRNNQPLFRHGSLRMAMFLKDIRIIFRKSQYSLMLFFPVMVSIPFAVPLILANSGVAQSNPLGLYYSLLTVPVVCASIYSLLTYISEGNAVSIMFSLPDLSRRSVKSKALVGIVIFSCIVIPMADLIMLAAHYNPLDYVLVPANLIIGFAFTYVAILNRLRKKLNPYITVVNVDTFGGSFGLLISFSMVLGLILVPVIAGELISTYAFGGSNSTLTLALDLMMNVFLLFITTLLIFRPNRSYLGKQLASVNSAED